jgi:hypothetical protein
MGKQELHIKLLSGFLGFKGCICNCYKIFEFLLISYYYLGRICYILYDDVFYLTLNIGIK